MPDEPQITIADLLASPTPPERALMAAVARMPVYEDRIFGRATVARRRLDPRRLTDKFRRGSTPASDVRGGSVVYGISEATDLYRER